MRQTPAVLVPMFLALAGCLSPPIPQELVDLGPPPAPEPILTQEVVRLSHTGLSDEVIVGLIRSRGVADRPGVADVLMLGHQGVSSAVQLALVAVPPARTARAPTSRIVYREMWIPLWPSYAGGRWHVGLRVGCFYRTVDEEPPKVRPKEPRLLAPQPEFIDP